MKNFIKKMCLILAVVSLIGGAIAIFKKNLSPGIYAFVMSYLFYYQYKKMIENNKN